MYVKIGGEGVDLNKTLIGKWEQEEKFYFVKIDGPGRLDRVDLYDIFLTIFYDKTNSL